MTLPGAPMQESGVPDMPSAEQLDFLLEQGKRFAILGSGERVEPAGELPADAGTHLVAGTARKCVRPGKELPPGRPWLDPCRRWHWCEVSTAINPAGGHLAIRRQV